MEIDTLTENFIAPLRSETLDVFFYFSTHIGGEIAAIIILLIMGYFFVFCESCRAKALTVIIAILGGELTKQVIKHFTARPRPPAIPIAEGLEHSFSFPSGHATFAVACYGTLCYLLYLKARTTTERILVVLSSILIIAVLAVSRLYLRVHYATDVLAGLALGLLWMCIAICTVAYIKKHYAFLK
jgi:undecaprenyl-diphosphatase